MDIDNEREIAKVRHLMEAIIYLENGDVRVETPYGREIPEEDRSECVQAMAEMYRNTPAKVKARVFLYKNGAMGGFVE